MDRFFAWGGFSPGGANGNTPPPSSGGTPPAPPSPLAGAPPPPPAPGGRFPRDPQAEALRAGFELDGAYREMHRAELMVQQVESLSPGAPECARARQLLGIASELYHEAHQAYRASQYLRAAEYAVAIKDLMRAIDKFYNVAVAAQ